MIGYFKLDTCLISFATCVICNYLLNSLKLSLNSKNNIGCINSENKANTPTCNFLLSAAECHLYQKQTIAASMETQSVVCLFVCFHARKDVLV